MTPLAKHATGDQLFGLLAKAIRNVDQMEDADGVVRPACMMVNLGIGPNV